MSEGHPWGHPLPAPLSAVQAVSLVEGLGGWPDSLGSQGDGKCVLPPPHPRVEKGGITRLGAPTLAEPQRPLCVLRLGKAGNLKSAGPSVQGLQSGCVAVVLYALVFGEELKVRRQKLGVTYLLLLYKISC